jgi:hypothetical protein
MPVPRQAAAYGGHSLAETALKSAIRTAHAEDHLRKNITGECAAIRYPEKAGLPRMASRSASNCPSMTDLNTAHHRPGSRRRSRRRGPLLPAIWFTILGLSWIGLMVVALAVLRPHPLTTSDYLVGSIGLGLGAFYFWVAYAVYRRRRYILTAAFVCAGFGLLSFPIGTAFAALLLSSLMARKHDFTK